MKQWRLPDRVFFAAGACHILAHAFLESHPGSGFQPQWIRPTPGYTGNHIVLMRDDVVFDYHGYSQWGAFWAHTKRRANQWWAGWDADIVPIHMEALISNREAFAYAGLHMKEPQDYLYDPFPRAQRYLQRFSAPCEATLSRIPATPLRARNGNGISGG